MHLQGVEFGQILFVNKRKLFRHIHIAIEINIAVCRMVIGPVKIQELLIGQIRNKLRVAA